MVKSDSAEPDFVTVVEVSEVETEPTRKPALSADTVREVHRRLDELRAARMRAQQTMRSRFVQ